MANILRIKRNTTNSNDPVNTQLKGGELAFNETTKVLFIGVGESAGNAASVSIVGGAPSNDNPSMNGTASAGTGREWSRDDHVHPTDSTRAPLASPTFTGVPAAPTAAVGTDTTQLATTAFVNAEIANDVVRSSTATDIKMNGTQAAGTNTTLARSDHVHPTDTSRAPTASPTLTGTVTVTGIAAITANSASPALQVTQTGSGPALLIEDSANPDSTPFTISTGGYVGIGTTTPVAPLDIRNGTINHTYSSADNQGSVIRLQKARGTNDAPTIALTGDDLGSILFAGYDGSLFTGGAMIAALTPSGSAVSPTNLPGQIDFYTTPVGSTTRSRAMSLLSTGVMDLQNHKIVNLADPVNPQDAATKAYVDAARSGLNVKASCRAATTANVDLSTTLTSLTIDTIQLAVGDRVLVKNQTNGTQNGIYVVSNLSGSGPNWVRASDFDTDAEVPPGAFTFIAEGFVNADSGWVLTTDSPTAPTPLPIIVGVSQLTFAQFSGAGQIIAGSGLTKNGNTLDVGGTANRITVNADSIDIASTYIGQASITTLGTVTTGTWSATTIGVNKGGTGLTTATANGVLYGNGTSAMGVTAAGTWDATNSVGQLLSVNASGVPTWTNTIDGGTY